MDDDKLYLGPESPADLEWSQGANNLRTEQEIDDIFKLMTYLDEDDDVKEDSPRHDGTSTDDTTMTFRHENNQPTQPSGDKKASKYGIWVSNRAPKGDTLPKITHEIVDITMDEAPQGATISESGPPEGETADTVQQQPQRSPTKRLSGAQRRKQAREMGKNLKKNQQPKAVETTSERKIPRNPYSPLLSTPPAFPTPKPLLATPQKSPARPPQKSPARPPPPPKFKPMKSTGKRHRVCDLVRTKVNVFAKLKENPQHTAIAINNADQHGVFSPQLCNTVIKAIMNGILTFPRAQSYGNEPFIPRFHWFKRIQGLLVFLCVDSETVNWLSNFNFLKAVEGSKIRILVERDFSKLVLCKASIPGPEREDKDIMKMLRMQNKDINFSRWAIKDKKQTPKGFKVVFVLDVPSLRTIRANKMKLYFGLSSILFFVLSPGSEHDAIDLPAAKGNPKTVPRHSPPKPQKSLLPTILDQFQNRGGPNLSDFSSNIVPLANIPHYQGSLAGSLPSREQLTLDNRTSARFEKPQGASSLTFEPPSSSQSQFRRVRSPPRSRSANNSGLNKSDYSYFALEQTGLNQATSNPYIFVKSITLKDRSPLRSDERDYNLDSSRSPLRTRDSFDRSRSPPRTRDPFDRSRSPPRTRDPFDRSRSPPRTRDPFDRSRSPPRTRDPFDRSRSPPRTRDSRSRDGGNIAFEQPKSSFESNRDAFSRLQNIPRPLMTIDVNDVPGDVHDIPSDVHDIHDVEQDMPRDVHDFIPFERPASSTISNSAQYTRSIFNNPNFKPYFKR